MRSSVVILFATCLTAALLPAVLLAQRGRDPLVYKRPHEVGIDRAVLRSAEQALAGQNPDCRAISEGVTAEIAKFTTQFVTDKRIRDERRTSQYDPRRLDKNTVRLLALARSQEFGRVHFLGESPLMYGLHTVLGRCFERENRPYRALAEYAMAMRYSTFEQPWQPRGPAADIAALAGEALSEREARYLLMLEGFANRDRIAQVDPGPERTAAENFVPTLDQYTRLKENTAAARMRIDAMIARRARGDAAADPDAAREQYRQLEAERVRLLGALEEIRRGPYRGYHRTRSARDGDTAYRMALLVKELETRNKKLSRILNRSSFYRGGGDSIAEDSTALRRFVGYALMLELANKLDPVNSRYVALLAEEYRTSRLYDRAIAFEERYIALKKDDATAAADLAEHYRRLAGLFTDNRNFIRAVQAYQESLRLQPNAPDAPQVRLHLAELMFERTGAFEAAAELYRQALADRARTDPAALGLSERVAFHAGRYRILVNLASIDRRGRRTDRELENLAAAVRDYRAIEQQLEAVERDFADLQIRINRLKSQLLDREDTALQLQYYQLLRRDLPDLKERLNSVRTQLGALNVPRVLERQALIAVRRGDLPGAIALYLDIVARGNGEQQTRARQNVSLLRRTLDDGITRRPLLPPDFER